MALKICQNIYLQTNTHVNIDHIIFAFDLQSIF